MTFYSGFFHDGPLEVLQVIAAHDIVPPLIRNDLLFGQRYRLDQQLVVEIHVIHLGTDHGLSLAVSWVG